MKKRRNRKNAGPQPNPSEGKPCGGAFTRTCCRAAIIAASYQVFSLGVGTVTDHPHLFLRREQGKTIVETVASGISSSLDKPAFSDWCLCAHLGQRGPGGGCGCTGCMGCMGCMACKAACTTGCISGCIGCISQTAAGQSIEINNTGVKYANEGDFEKAVEYLKKAVELDPNNQVAKDNLHYAEEQLKQQRARERLLSEDKTKVNTMIQNMGAQFGSGSQTNDPGVVDLSFMDPNKPMVVDPRRVKGETASAAPGGDLDFIDPNKPAARGKKMDLTLVKGATPQLRTELLARFSDTVSQRTAGANEQAEEILRSFNTGRPPSPVKNISDLAPGDVILVAPVPLRARIKDETKEHLKDVMISNGVNLLDRWGSDNWTSPASHAAIFLGKRNGKNWYLDNTGVGPVIKDEKEFLKEYGQRRMDVATLVGQPLSQHEGQELWKGAHELRNTTSYGVKFFQHNGNDAMVCSEASRWLLLRAGRGVPETTSENLKIGRMDTGLNKKQFVNFSPSDFYEEQQYFVIHRLGVNREAR